MTEADKLRGLPSVDEVLARLSRLDGVYPRTLVVAEVRRCLNDARGIIRAGGDAGPIERLVAAALEQLSRSSLRPVINATGVVLHTNLGRAPIDASYSIRGYSNLEYDLATGKRGRRDVHTGPLFERLLGRPAIAVNNNAAAVYLALHELAAGYEVIVSRGELIEIGDGFRIPDIMQRSGAILREVGTTNRTRSDDYRRAINERTRLILRVHPSNFRIQGFTARPELGELVAMAREHNLTVYEDLGSGCLTDLRPYGVDEPVVSHSLAEGVDLVSFSGDKLLGGPQAGILSGRSDLIERLRRNPMFRALRLDKIIYQALEATLRHLLFEEWDHIPTLRMIRQTSGQIRARAEALLSQLPAGQARLIEGRSVIGGGSTPEQSIASWLIAIETPGVTALERRLRLGDPPVIARIDEGRLLLDLRTVFPEEETALAGALTKNL